MFNLRKVLWISTLKFKSKILYRRASLFTDFLSANSLIHIGKIVQNDNFPVKNGLFICKFNIRGPKPQIMTVTYTWQWKNSQPNNSWHSMGMGMLQEMPEKWHVLLVIGTSPEASVTFTFLIDYVTKFDL